MIQQVPIAVGHGFQLVNQVAHRCDVNVLSGELVHVGTNVGMVR